MSVAAKFPVDVKESLENLAYFIDEPQEVDNLVGGGQIPTQDAKISLGSVSLRENLEQHEKDAKKEKQKNRYHGR